MPELPEVEIQARRLRERLADRRLARCEVYDPLLEEGLPAELRKAALPGRLVVAILRRAKYLIVEIEGGWSLVAHLRMTGRFTWADADAPARPARMALVLEDGARLQFVDPRRFGRVWLVPAAELSTVPGLAGLGPDALAAPPSFRRLRELSRRARRSIKSLLMDQRLIGGLGNICATEILYRARVAPGTPACEVTDAAVRAIAGIIPVYLEWAIAAQETRELVYLGEKGAENVFTIYRRAGTPCPVCGTPIARTVVAGRGTYFCPGCQGSHAGRAPAPVRGS